ncbi:hypothetical protein J6590_008469 [Homalodisca vitripennis]|nr:hypothetical protein J6590_008469 [Homalodisca vitripennis]
MSVICSISKGGKCEHAKSTSPTNELTQRRGDQSAIDNSSMIDSLSATQPPPPLHHTPPYLDCFILIALIYHYECPVAARIPPQILRMCRRGTCDLCGIDSGRKPHTTPDCTARNGVGLGEVLEHRTYKRGRLSHSSHRS